MSQEVESGGVHAMEERARTILESITEAFFSLDGQFRFTYLNRTAERFLQKEIGELVGKSLWEEFPAARGTAFERMYRHAMSARERVEFVEYYPAPLDRWYEVRAYPSPEGIAVYFQDITERRKAEEAYRRSRDQLELVVRSANVGVWYCPLPFDELLWDDQVKEHFFLPPDARVTIETFYERIHPDDREPTRTAIARSIEEKVSYDIDYRTVAPDGRSKWIRALGRAFYGPDGSPIQFDGVTIDVSDRKRTELLVIESERRYRLATRATNDAIWDWDLATNEVRWNEAFHRLFGHATTESSADLWSSNIHPADRDRILTAIHAAIANASIENWQAEYRFRRADGTFADVLDRGFVVRDASGNAVRMLGAMQDLTDRKKVERERETMIEAERAARSEAERQSRMKDEFLATLSHELRTPLNAVLGWSQVALAKAAPGSEIYRALETIARNARAQATIVNDLLDMNRIVSGKVRLDLKPADLGAVVAATVETTLPTADAKGVSMSVTLPAPEATSAVTVDANRLQQVVWNLLTNAIKFTPKGGRVRVEVELDHDQAIIRVADTGEGISPEFLPYVFDRFRQADASTTRRHGGLGLGLSIVKQVVELHGGSVRADSEGVGQGATFTVTLPRVARALPEVGGKALPTASTDRLPVTVDVDITGVRALVVDDEPDARLLVARLLEERGAVVLTVGSAKEALTALDRAAFDVLVSDIGMPGEDGYSLMREIRRRPPASGGTIAAIALTAFARPEDRMRAIAAGFVMHITKPVDAAELVMVVAGATGRLT